MNKLVYIFAKKYCFMIILLIFIYFIQQNRIIMNDFSADNAQISYEQTCEDTDVVNLKVYIKTPDLDDFKVNTDVDELINTDSDQECYYEICEELVDEAIIQPQYDQQVSIEEPAIVTTDDVILLAKVIYAEADPNSYEDNCYVGAVVLNRLDCGYWGDSISSVIFAPGQYACTWNGSKKFASYPPDYTIEIANQLLAGERFGVPPKVVFQAGFVQGPIWKIVGGTYYCYSEYL